MPYYIRDPKRDHSFDNHSYDYRKQHNNSTGAVRLGVHSGSLGDALQREGSCDQGPECLDNAHYPDLVAHIRESYVHAVFMPSQGDVSAPRCPRPCATL